MSRFVHSDLASAIDIQAGAVVSRVIFSDKRTEVTVFGFDAGAGLSEHQASRAAIVHVTRGRLEFTVEGEQLDAGPGFWLHMEPGTPHSSPRANRRSCSSPSSTLGEPRRRATVEALSRPDSGLSFA